MMVVCIIKHTMVIIYLLTNANSIQIDGVSLGSLYSLLPCDVSLCGLTSIVDVVLNGWSW